VDRDGHVDVQDGTRRPWVHWTLGAFFVARGTKDGEMLKRVYLIRHGETEGNATGRFSGSTDLPLTPRGMRQVRRLSELLPDHLLAPAAGTWCVASPLLRAQQSAEAVAGRRGLSVSTDADLREMDFGMWEGLTAEEIDARFPGALGQWLAPTDDTAFPEGESLGDFNRRVARVRDRILGQQAEVVLVFAHGGVVRGLICALLGLGAESFWLFDVRPASVARIDVFEGGAVLSELWSVTDGEVD
jgi:alpha-ribazole phosphatase